MVNIIFYNRSNNGSQRAGVGYQAYLCIVRGVLIYSVITRFISRFS